MQGTLSPASRHSLPQTIDEKVTVSWWRVHSPNTYVRWGPITSRFRGLQKANTNFPEGGKVKASLSQVRRHICQCDWYANNDLPGRISQSVGSSVSEQIFSSGLRSTRPAFNVDCVRITTGHLPCVPREHRWVRGCSASIYWFLLGPRKAACGLAPAAISSSSSGHGVGSPNLNKSPHAMEPAAHSSACLSLSLSIESGDTPEEEASNGSGGRHWLTTFTADDDTLSVPGLRAFVLRATTTLHQLSHAACRPVEWIRVESVMCPGPVRAYVGVEVGQHRVDRKASPYAAAC
jgi:hypothetical protein